MAAAWIRSFRITRTKSRSREGRMARRNMANYWMHSALLKVEGQKMSKSEGNFVTINELLDGWRDFNWPGDVIRFAMFSTHYRQPMDFSQHALEQASIALENFLAVPTC